MIQKIAIAGPDGAGKTTVCEHLSQRLDNCRIEYGGKARNHKLKATRFAHSLMSKAQALWAPLYFPFRYFWFYFFEYFENRKRFIEEASDGAEHIIFDRHPIDRLLLPIDIDLKLEYGRISRLRWSVEKIPRSFWAFVYRHFFTVPVAVFVLLPEPELCFQRSNGQYPTVEDALIRVDSYRKTIERMKDREHYTVIEVSDSMTVDAITDQILKQLNATQP
jgi:thymidylate kinase